MDENNSISNQPKMVKHAGVVAFFTLCSRLFGLARDTLVAYVLGAKEAADAFYVAFRIPNLLRRLVAEGNLTISFVPIFSQYLKQSSREAKKVSDITFTVLSLLLVLLSILGVVGAGFFVKMTAPGFASDPEKFALTVFLTRITFPYIFLVSLAALCMGVLNSRFRFAPSAAAPIFLNLGIIISTLLFKDFFSHPSVAIAWGVLLGGLLQLLIQVPFLIREGFLFRVSFQWAHPGIKKIGKLMLPAVFGSAVYQLNVFAITVMASFLPTGSVSYLWYADRISEFPLGIFGISLATVALPSFSHFVANNDREGLKKAFREGLRLTWFVNIPASIGLAVIALPVISFIFQRGDFDRIASMNTAEALIYFSLGLPFVSASRMLTSFFYSIEEARKPVISAVVAVIVNIVVGVSLMGPMLHKGLALGVACGSMANFFLLLWFLRRQVGLLGLRRLVLPTLKFLLGAILMGLVLFFIQHFLPQTTELSQGLRAVFVMSLIVVGILLYGVLAWLLKVEECSLFLQAMRKKKSPQIT